MSTNYSPRKLNKCIHTSWPWVFAAVLFVLVCFEIKGSLWCLECLVGDTLVNPWLESAHMFSCSNIRQTILLEKSENIELHDSDIPGWRYWTPVNKSHPAVLAVSIVKDREQAVFYPRISGINSSISVYEVVGMDTWKPLAVVDSDSNKWSEIGRQCKLNLYCLLDNQKNHKEFNVTLYFVLSGQWSQLWEKETSVIF